MKRYEDIVRDIITKSVSLSELPLRWRVRETKNDFHNLVEIVEVLRERWEPIGRIHISYVDERWVPTGYEIL